MKYLKFYKLHDWILEEFGASSEAVIIAIIYSFAENGTECKMSYSQFADVLRCTRPRAIDKIRRLIEAGYISVITNGTHINTYTVNCEVFNNDGAASSPSGTSYDAASSPSGTSASSPSGTSASIKNGTSASSPSGTRYIIEKKREVKREVKRERERSGEAAAPPTLDEVSKYFNEIGCSESASVFVDYYTARSWKGIHDWKAAARAWMQRGQRRPDAPAPQRSAPQSVRSSSIDLSQIRFDNES